MASTESAPLFKRRKPIGKDGLANKRSKQTVIVTKRSRDSDESDDSDDGDVLSDSDSQKIKKSSSTKATIDYGSVQFDHTHSTRVSNTSDATAEDTIIKETLLAENSLKRRLGKVDQVKEGSEGNAVNPVGMGQEVYKGNAAYNKIVPGNTTKFGPIKSAANIRRSTVIDYQPDVCKDYKQTGFCGYGDSCKFLHAREDYAAGWKLDKEWELQKKKEAESKDSLKQPDSTEGPPPEIPFKCVICKEDYKQPVVSPCEHYFCEKCFLTEYRKRPGCFICGKNTGGVAKPAKKLKDLLKKRGLSG